MQTTKNKKYKIISLSLCLVLVFVAMCLLVQPAYGASCGETDTLLIDCDASDGANAITSVVKKAINIGSILIGIACVIGISIAGVQYLTARGNEDRVTKSKRRIYEILLGIFVYVLLYTGASFLLPGGLNFEIELPEMAPDKVARQKPEPEYVSKYDGKLGTAGNVTDRTAVVSIFLNEAGCWNNSNWDSASATVATDRSIVAYEWLKKQMGNSKNFNYVYDFKDPVLTKTIADVDGTCIADRGSSGYFILLWTLLKDHYPMTQKECEGKSDCTSMEEIKKLYGVDNVVFNFYLNASDKQKPDSLGGYTIPYRPNTAQAVLDGYRQLTHYSYEEYGYEFSVMLKPATENWNSGHSNYDLFATGTIIHEVLHQFAALDLYCTDGKVKEVPVSYQGCGVTSYEEMLRTPQAMDMDVMGNGYAYKPFATMDDVKMTDITKYYTGIIPESPNETGFARYGTWGVSQYQL